MHPPATPTTPPACRRTRGATIRAVLLGGAAPPLAAQPSLQVAVAGFVDVNGNGILDCGEPVLLSATYATRDSGTPALTGSLTIPGAGTSGLVYQPGTLRIDNDLTVGCQPTVARGNGPGDTSGAVNFSCPADPLDNNSWTVVVTWQALFESTTSPAFTATAQATTSDGRSFDAASQGAGAAACGAATPSHVSLQKTAAGSGAPGSTLLYTLTVRDLSGLGDGGLQLVDTVPANTTFDAAASAAGWVCAPDGNPGALCRNPVGNLAADGTLTSLFAVTLASPLAAGVSVINNTACVREGPTTVAACASVATATTGAAALKVVKSLTQGTGAPGGVLTWDLAVQNTGNQGAGSVVLAETVPAATAFDAAGSPGWSCVPAAGPAGASCTDALGTLAAGATLHGTFAVTVASPLPAGITAIANTACASAAGLAPVCASVSSPTHGNPHLSLAKSYAGPALAAGATLVFQLAYANTGDQDAAAASLGETVPDATAFAAAASSPGWTCSPAAGGPGATCTLALGPLPADASGTRTFALTAAAPLPAGLQQIANSSCLTDAAGDTACSSAQTPPQPPGNPGGPGTPTQPAAVPTLGSAGLATLFTLLGSVAVGRLRRRNKPGGGPPPAAPLAPPTGGRSRPR